MLMSSVFDIFGRIWTTLEPPHTAPKSILRCPLASPRTAIFKSAQNHILGVPDDTWACIRISIRPIKAIKAIKTQIKGQILNDISCLKCLKCFTCFVMIGIIFMFYGFLMIPRLAYSCLQGQSRLVIKVKSKARSLK